MGSAVGSESMGETRPGERIRRGSIRPTKLSPDLELWGELGYELMGLELLGSEVGPRPNCCFLMVWVWKEERERVSGDFGGLLKEQHQEVVVVVVVVRRRDWAFRWASEESIELEGGLG